MAAGATRLIGAAAGFDATGGADGEALEAAIGDCGAVDFGVGAGRGAAAARGSRTVLPHWPQLLAPPPA